MTKITLVTFNIAPPHNRTRKYTDMGPAVVARLRCYAMRHGYGFLGRPLNPTAHPVCWEKFNLILGALETADWVIWVDSDAMLVDMIRPVSELLICDADFVTQCATSYLSPLGLNQGNCLAMMPFNTGVFATRNTSCARMVLRNAAAMRCNLSTDLDWHGIGDQEAMIKCLDASDAKIAYAQHLQSHPAHVTDLTYFVHLYGNHAAQLMTNEHAENVIKNWHTALTRLKTLPPGLAQYHWACIQNMSKNDAICRGGPERFFYNLQDIVGQNGGE